jgi:hypothetical protein
VSPTLSFPGANAEWNSKNGVPRLQWRDRAGLSPDFPFKPLRAPKNWFKSYHAGAADVNESSLAKRLTRSAVLKFRFARVTRLLSQLTSTADFARVQYQ